MHGNDGVGGVWKGTNDSVMKESKESQFGGRRMEEIYKLQ